MLPYVEQGPVIAINAWLLLIQRRFHCHELSAITPGWYDLAFYLLRSRIAINLLTSSAVWRDYGRSSCCPK